MMHGPEKSDPGIVAMKPANKTEQSVAEPVERRAGTKGNADQQSTGAVGELVGIDGGVVSGVINLESSGVEASDWRPRHDERYHEA